MRTGRVVPHDEVMRRLRATIARHAPRREATVWSADALDEFDEIVGYIARDDCGQRTGSPTASSSDRRVERVQRIPPPLSPYLRDPDL
jgi:hypothetical protein